jgi:hypothetical protein
MSAPSKKRLPDAGLAAGVPAGARRWIEADAIHIDVRGLPPPEPLVAILALVQTVRDAATVIVHHDRDPMMLYAELAELGWAADRIDAPAGEVRLRLERVP